MTISRYTPCFHKIILILQTVLSEETKWNSCHYGLCLENDSDDTGDDTDEDDDVFFGFSDTNSTNPAARASLNPPSSAGY